MIEPVVSRFIRYANCASESHNEKAFCEYIEKELTSMDIPYTRQELGNEVVTDGWNILAKVPGQAGKSPFLFVFHLDTAPPSNHVEAYVEDGRILSRGTSVLGADGKLAIAVVLEIISHARKSGTLNRPIEMLFTVCQEVGLHGTKYADYSAIESEEAIVIDHYVTGEVLLQTPSRHYIHVELIGQGSHVIHDNGQKEGNALTAAVDIIHQIPVGRINENLNINIFDLVSLSASNIMPKHSRFDVEVRCFGDATRKEIYQRIHSIAEETAVRMNCRCSIQEELDIPEADFSANADMLKRLDTIYRHSGITMKTVRSFGVMDSTCTNQLGIRTVPIGLNIYHSHSAREYVAVQDIEQMLELIKNIILEF